MTNHAEHQLERIRKDTLLYPHTNYIFKITTNVHELLSNSSESINVNSEHTKNVNDSLESIQQQPSSTAVNSNISSSTAVNSTTTILTPSPSIRYFLLHRDGVFQCWKGFIGIPSSFQTTTITQFDTPNSFEFSLLQNINHQESLNTSISPLIGMTDLCQDVFIHEVNHFEKPIDYHGYSPSIFSKLNIHNDEITKNINDDDNNTITTSNDHSNNNHNSNNSNNNNSNNNNNNNNNNTNNIITTSNDHNTTIQYMEMDQHDISQFKKHFKSIYWFGFDCNHSLAMNLFVLNRMSEDSPLFEMLMELLENSPMDFIDVSPMEYPSITHVDDHAVNLQDHTINNNTSNSSTMNNTDNNNTTDNTDNNNTTTTTSNPHNDIEIVRQMIDEYLPERSYKTFQDCLELTHTLNSILYSYEEIKRQQQYLQLTHGKYIDLKSVWNASINKGSHDCHE
ncbi:hypothetical protein C9374_006956 [Naegleria lovaniensis]|uniref:Uncharacterized protein n=1 Tax=Naegleria lovaniensis TaxID=51637 RepID=A0AA88GYQ8_NAELO|nr:uncharacterized protein C9374_006956 [Naegleria lovaniensis]KAG2393425.1 hypothetical protein C9374_006956 [Naegleria lovaniensis]